MNMAASGISVEAARANPMIAAELTSISAPSNASPGLKRRRNQYSANAMADASITDGNRAAQSLTPNIL